MNLSFVKLFSKRPAAVFRVPRAVSVQRMLGAAVVAAWALVALPAHAQDPSPDSDDTAVSVPDALGPPSEQEQKDLPNIALSSQIVFQVLAAEVALQRNQLAPAYQTYLALARDTHDPRMAQRATEIALGAQSPTDALASARRSSTLRCSCCPASRTKPRRCWRENSPGFPPTTAATR